MQLEPVHVLARLGTSFDAIAHGCVFDFRACSTVIRRLRNLRINVRVHAIKGCNDSVQD